MFTRPWRERLEITNDPRHRAIIETMLRHVQTEFDGDLDGVMDTMSSDPVYINTEGDGPRGRAEVRDFYARMFAHADLGNMRVENVRLIIDDDAILTESRVSQVVPGWRARELGYTVPDESGHYAVHRHHATVLPFDSTGKLCGEVAYARQNGPLDWDRIPDDELSAGYLEWLKGR